MLSGNDNSNSNGIFVLNGQVFSVNDLINAMRRQGIHIHLSKDGLSIDGEYIPSITNLEGDRCPLAKNCEKRIALVEFLKLRKKEGTFDFEREPRQSSFQDSSFTREFPIKERTRESPTPDFIQPNNHDLFEGNVSNSRGLFDEPVQESPRGLFDEPDFNADERDLSFEDSFFEQRPHEGFDSDFTQDNQGLSNTFDMHRDSHSQNHQLFCQRCGYDLQQNWKVCPSCGKQVEPQSSSHSEDYLF